MHCTRTLAASSEDARALLPAARAARAGGIGLPGTRESRRRSDGDANVRAVTRTASVARRTQAPAETRGRVRNISGGAEIREGDWAWQFMRRPQATTQSKGKGHVQESNSDGR